MFAASKMFQQFWINFQSWSPVIVASRQPKNKDLDWFANSVLSNLFNEAVPQSFFVKTLLWKFSQKWQRSTYGLESYFLFCMLLTKHVIKIGPQQRCFPVNFPKISWKTILENIRVRLLLSFNSFILNTAGKVPKFGFFSGECYMAFEI